MGVLALHGSNYKAGQLAALDRHNLRENRHYSNKEIDRSRTKENVVLVRAENSLYQEAKRRIEKEVAPYQKRKLRKDANWITEFVVTVPEGVREQREESIRYCRAVIDYFGGRVGVDNIISAVVHMDETTPHMHLDFTPIVGHTLSAKKIMTRRFLQSLHDELPQYLQKKGFSVERGVHEPELARQKSRNIHRYKREMETQKETLGKQIQVLQAVKQELQKENYKMAERLISRMKSRGYDR